MIPVHQIQRLVKRLIRINNRYAFIEAREALRKIVEEYENKRDTECGA